ncbi:hypothetical protein ABZ611_29700 [Streptomyces sp. NPDC007861]|uniref:hypothetical protein n=1 Tax=Streptomyces sp. NPDC007861 TaxID=3154893 RepID=UPI0033C89739
MSGHRFTAHTPVSACAAALVAAVLVMAGGSSAYAGDDIESLSAQQISERAKEALRGAASVHFVTEGSLNPAGTTSELDLRLDRDGNCAGTVSTGAKGSVEIVKRGTTVWMKPDETFWKSQVPGTGERAAELFKDRYLRGSTDDPVLSSMAEVCDLERLVKSVTDSPDLRLPLTKGEKTEVDGVEVIPVIAKQAGKTVTMYVAAEGTPYPVRLDAVQAGEGEASIALSDYGEPVPSATPPADRSIDISTLMERGN